MFWKKATAKSVEHFLVMGCYVLFLLFKRFRRILCTSLLACFLSGSFSGYLSWIMNKSRLTLIHLGFRARSCGRGFSFTNAVTLTEQLNGIYGIPFLLQIFIDGFLRNSAENITDNIITNFHS